MNMIIYNLCIITNFKVWKHRRFTKYNLRTKIRICDIIKYVHIDSALFKSNRNIILNNIYILTTVILFISSNITANYSIVSMISMSVHDAYIETKTIDNVGRYSVPASELCCWQIRSTRKSSRLEEAAAWGPQTSALFLQQCSGGTHRRAWLVRHSCSSNSIFDGGSRSKPRDTSWRHPGGTVRGGIVIRMPYPSKKNSPPSNPTLWWTSLTGFAVDSAYCQLGKTIKNGKSCQCFEAWYNELMF